LRPFGALHKISPFLDKPPGLDGAMAQDSASDLERRLAQAERELSEVRPRPTRTMAKAASGGRG
jgi:hypothetical protein